MTTGLADLSEGSEYEIRIDSHAQRDLRRLSRSDYRRVDERICALGQNPRPMGVVKLRDKVHRIRIGSWRVDVKVVRRMLDPRHRTAASRIGALHELGRELVVETRVAQTVR